MVDEKKVVLMGNLRRGKSLSYGYIPIIRIFKS